MKTFIEILNETEFDDIKKKLGLGKEYILFHNDKWVVDTKHSIERKEQRGFTKEIEQFLKDTIDYIIDKKLPAKNREYLVLSKSKHLGMVVAHKKDEKNRVKGNLLSIVSWFGDVTKPPLNKKSIKDVFVSRDKKDVTTKILVEFVENEIIEVDEIIELG